MTKRTQRCTQCGSRLNITKIEEGTKFACFNCGAILVAGDQAKAVRKSLDDGPVFKPRSGEEESSTPTRSRRKRSPADAPASTSRTPLLVGIGVVVVIAGVVAAVMMGGGSKGGGAGGGGGGAAASTETAEQWWARVGGDVEGASAEDLRRLVREAHAAGHDKSAFWKGIADQIHEALIQKAPDDATANRYYGRKALHRYPGFQKLWAALYEREKLLPEEFRAFLKKYEDRIEGGGKVWLDAEEYEAAAQLLVRFKEWLQKLASDPSLEWIAKGRSRARGELDKFDAGAKVAAPFVLFVGYRPADPGSDPTAERTKREEIAARYTAALKLLHKEFETRFREPLGLPVEYARRPLYIWLFDAVGDYDTFSREKKLFGADSSLKASFYPRSGWVYAGLPADEAQAQYMSRDLTHGAVHQLQWQYSKDPKKHSRDFDNWNGLWFTIGFAAWLGGGIESDGTAAEFTGIDPRHAAHLKAMRDHKVSWVTLRDLTQIESWEGLSRWIGDTWWPSIRSGESVNEETVNYITENHGARGFAMRTVYAQAWALAHFLNETQRSQYRDLLMTALRGKRKPKKYATGRLGRWYNTYTAFAEIFGLKSDADWDRMQGRYVEHMQKLAR